MFSIESGLGLLEIPLGFLLIFATVAGLFLTVP